MASAEEEGSAKQAVDGGGSGGCGSIVASVILVDEHSATSLVVDVAAAGLRLLLRLRLKTKQTWVVHALDLQVCR